MEYIILIILYGIPFVLGFYYINTLLTQLKNIILKANVTGIRWETQTKPIFGGITFFSLFIFGIINYVLLFKGDFLTNNIGVGIILVVTISFLIGLADDLLNSSPFFKFFAQLACALLLINFDIYIKIFESQTLNYLLTVFWVVGIMNSINMLDNMDAITSSISTLIFAFFILVVIYQDYVDKWFYLIVLVSAIAVQAVFYIQLASFKNVHG